MTVTIVRFAELCRALGSTARAHALAAPAYRSPPQGPSTRTLRRLRDGGAVVAVVIKGRTDMDIAKDLIDGTLAANQRELDDPLRQPLEDAVTYVFNQPEHEATRIARDAALKDRIADAPGKDDLEPF